MREIKFKGKRVIRNNRKIFKGESLWVYGDLIKSTNNYIEDLEGRDISLYKYSIKVNTGKGCYNQQLKNRRSATYEVEKGSIGQYIGLKDNSNNEIYEGDKVVIDDTIGEVFWNNETASFMVEIDNEIIDFDHIAQCDIEVYNEEIYGGINYVKNKR